MVISEVQQRWPSDMPAASGYLPDVEMLIVALSVSVRPGVAVPALLAVDPVTCLPLTINTGLALRVFS
jgi:hypothetical protein